MSGPTWLPPRTVDSPERTPQMSHSAGSAIYRAPNKKATPDFRPKYGAYDQNGGGGGGMANRYMASGSTGGPIHHSSSDHYYSPPHGPKDDRNWSPHMDSYELMHRGPEKPASYHSKIDADIDSLTSMLADLDSHPQDASTQLYDNVPYNKYLSGDHYKPAHQSAAPPQTQTSQQGWYPPHPGSQAQEMHSEAVYKGSGSGAGGRVNQFPPSKRGMESNQAGPGATQSPPYQSSKQAIATTRPEEELDRLTKKLVYDMNHPPVEDYFGRCARCGDNVVGDGSGCIAMEQVFHVECFTCITCHARLRGQPFYALDKKSYCESCYISTLERCSKCSKPILDRILRAMGKAYHPRCFTCVVCNCCLDGVPFTVDATSQIHCIDDFHRKYAPRCSVCGEPIMPEQGQEETVRIVALDRSFHVNCYICEECGLLLSSEGEGRGCYPLDGHILCKSCSACRIQDLSAKISTDC